MEAEMAAVAEREEDDDDEETGGIGTVADPEGEEEGEGEGSGGEAAEAAGNLSLCTESELLWSDGEGDEDEVTRDVPEGLLRGGILCIEFGEDGKVVVLESVCVIFSGIVLLLLLVFIFAFVFVFIFVFMFVFVLLFMSVFTLAEVSPTCVAFWGEEESHFLV